MRDQDIIPPSRRPAATTKRLMAALLLTLSTLAMVPLLSRAQTTATIRVVNNSAREIHNIFLSPVGVEAWGADLLDNTVVGANQTHTLNGVTCDGDNVKVIAEDQHGCFMTQVVSCGGEAEWVVTNDTPADCGN